MAVSLAMLTLADFSEVQPEALLQALQKDWPDLMPLGGMEQESAVLSFEAGGGTVFLSHMPGPIPWGDLEEPCASSVVWPEAEATLRAHQSHIVVAISGEEPALVKARVLTQVIASAIAVCPAATGVYWGNARLVIPAALFRETAQACLPQELPLPLWVGIRAGHSEKGRSAGFTRGLDSLGLMDIETISSTETPSDLYGRLQSIAGYLVEKGLVINDGDTVGESADEKIRVVYTPSRFGSSGQVLNLEYDPARKPFWKFW